MNLGSSHEVDWINGFYLHVSGPEATALLPAIRRCTFTATPFQRGKAMTLGDAEALCNAAGYGTSVGGAAPDFPRMQHVDYCFDTPAPVSGVGIPLLPNLYGSDLGPGFPLLSFWFDSLQLAISWSDDVLQALQDDTVLLQVLTLECGFMDALDDRHAHCQHRHVKNVPVPSVEMGGVTMVATEISTGRARM